jgi:S1-C subfamily serine protease
MNTAVSAQAQGIGFAIPLSQELINTTLQTIQQRQKIVRPLLGINYIDISHHSKQQYSLDQSYGALVTEV